MKSFSLAVIMLFNVGLYSQNNLVAIADTTIDEEITYLASEPVVDNTADEILLGELNVKSKKGNCLTSTGRITCYFENTIGENYIESLFVKTRKVKLKTEVHIRFYKRRDYTQEYYAPEDGKKSAYESFIPGEQVVTEEIVVMLEPGQKGITEFDLSKYNITMPAEGLFVSLENAGYFDVMGNIVSDKDVKSKNKTWVDFHPTTKDDYCDWVNPQGTQSWFWVNINKGIKNDFDVVFKEKPSSSILRAPSFGLKVVRK